MNPLPASIVYRGLEFFFWIISSILWTACIAAIVYQLGALYIPYWRSTLAGHMHSFPDYFYRVYGDDVSALAFEHYGYLVSAILVCALSGPLLLTKHPWTSDAPHPIKEEGLKLKSH